jgi:hypothetical protein
MFNYAGLRTVKEEPHCFKALFPDNDMRPDLSIQNWPKLNPKSHKLILDIAICNPISFNGSLSLNQANNLGRLSDQRFRSKVSKYSNVAIQSSLEFVPFIIESTGRFHKVALELFDDAITYLCNGDNKSSLFTRQRLFWSGRISCALQKAISSSMIRKSVLINSSFLQDRDYRFDDTRIFTYPS